MKFHLTPKSSNKKTGPIPVSTSPRDTCPNTCVWKDGGCYADGGPLRIHWNKISDGSRGSEWGEFIEKIKALPIGQLWRHNQAGDFTGDNEYINITDLLELTSANHNKRGFTYTHYPVEGNSKQAKTNRQAIKFSNEHGFTINLSADSPEHADKLLKLAIGPVVTMLPSDTKKRKMKTPDGNTIWTCPAFFNEKTTCKKCGVCADKDRTMTVGFPSHGFRKQLINEALSK